MQMKEVYIQVLKRHSVPLMLLNQLRALRYEASRPQVEKTEDDRVEPTSSLQYSVEVSLLKGRDGEIP